MRSLIYAAAVAVLMAGTAAEASVSLSFTGATSSSVSVLDPVTGQQISGGTSMGGFAESMADQPVFGLMYGSSASSLVSINQTAASFTSGVASRGPNASEVAPGGSASATSGIVATVTNDGHAPVVLKSITSDIIQAGMGFMVQDPDPNVGALRNNLITGYGVNSAGNFSDFYQGFAETLATASFSFNIYGPDYGEASDVPALYTVTGTMSIGFDANGNLIETADVTDAMSKLDGFQSVYSNNPGQIDGYEWSETPINVGLGDILLGAGASTNLYYVANSSVDISSPCVLAGDGTPECIVAYSGFGDPVGRGGGISNFAHLGSSLGGPPPCPNNDTQICFQPQTVTPFSELVTGSVPEPNAWALMISGFGLAGAALRRRRVVSYS